MGGVEVVKQGGGEARRSGDPSARELISPEGLCLAYEEERARQVEAHLPTRLCRGRRRGRSRETGLFYTPPLLAQLMVQQALSVAQEVLGLSPAALELLDPACGAGAFLVAAARQGVSRLLGLDTDPRALQVAARALDALGHRGPRELHRGDALEAPLPPARCIVANPPYVSSDTLPSGRRKVLRERFADWCKPGSKPDLYIYFLARITDHLLAHGGVGCVIVPNRLLTGDVTAPLRGRMQDVLLEVMDLAHLRVFPAADVHPVILLLARPSPRAAGVSHLVRRPTSLEEAPAATRVPVARDLVQRWGGLWLTTTDEDLCRLLTHVATHPHLGDVAHISEGMRGGSLDPEGLEALPPPERVHWVREFRGRHVSAYQVAGTAGFYRIGPTPSAGSRRAHQLGRKAVFPELASRLCAALQEGHVAYGGVYYVAEARSTRPLEVLVAVLCSPLATVLYRILHGAGAWGSSLKVRSTYLARLPLPAARRHDSHLVALVRHLHACREDAEACRAVERLVYDLYDLPPALIRLVEERCPSRVRAALPGLDEAIDRAWQVAATASPSPGP